MPTVTVSTIIDRARIKTDNVDSEFMSDAEALLLLNDLRMSLYTNLYTKCDQSLFLEEVEIDVTDGSASIPSDVFQIKKIEGRAGIGGVYYNLEPRSLSEVSSSDEYNSNFVTSAPSAAYYYLIKNTIKVRPSSSVTGIRILYNPIPTPIAAITETIDTVFHEDRWLVASLAIEIANKEETDATPWFIEKNDVFIEILQSYKRDRSYPKKIVDVAKRYPNRTRGRIRW